MKRIPLLSLLPLALFTTATWASPFSNNVINDVYSANVNGIPTANDENDGIPDLHDAVNNILGTNYTRNAQLDDRFYEPDAIFNGSGRQRVALVGLTADNSNTLGIYTDLGLGANKTDVLGPVSGFGFTGNGTTLDPYMGAIANVTGSFGWFLRTNAETYYSEAELNDGLWDHMMAFDLSELNGQARMLEVNGQVVEHIFTNAFLIGWEDLAFNNGVLGDDDYDDMMYLIDFSPINQVPEPLPLAMFALGLLGFAQLRRHNKP